MDGNNRRTGKPNEQQFQQEEAILQKHPDSVTLRICSFEMIPSHFVHFENRGRNSLDFSLSSIQGRSEQEMIEMKKENENLRKELLEERKSKKVLEDCLAFVNRANDTQKEKVHEEKSEALKALFLLGTIIEFQNKSKDEEEQGCKEKLEREKERVSELQSIVSNYQRALRKSQREEHEVESNREGFLAHLKEENDRLRELLREKDEETMRLMPELAEKEQKAKEIGEKLKETQEILRKCQEEKQKMEMNEEDGKKEEKIHRLRKENIKLSFNLQERKKQLVQLHEKNKELLRTQKGFEETEARLKKALIENGFLLSRAEFLEREVDGRARLAHEASIQKTVFLTRSKVSLNEFQRVAEQICMKQVLLGAELERLSGANLFERERNERLVELNKGLRRSLHETHSKMAKETKKKSFEEKSPSKQSNGMKSSEKKGRNGSSGRINRRREEESFENSSGSSEGRNHFEVSFGGSSSSAKKKKTRIVLEAEEEKASRAFCGFSNGRKIKKEEFSIKKSSHANLIKEIDSLLAQDI